MDTPEVLEGEPIWCKVCLIDLDQFTICQVCGSGGLCADCADECAEYDQEETNQ